MGELKQHQPPLAIEEQIENLKGIGLIVDDEDYAKKILNDISYFRLIKAYSLNLKPGRMGVFVKECIVYGDVSGQASCSTMRPLSCGGAGRLILPIGIRQK